MASGTRSGKNRDDICLSKLKTKTGKGSIVSGSSTNGSLRSRHKVGDRKDNKSSTSSSSSSRRSSPTHIDENEGLCGPVIRRSERLEKPCQSSSSSQSKSDTVEQKASLRRSERIEKIGTPSPTCSMKSGNNSSSDLVVRNRNTENGKSCAIKSIVDGDCSTSANRSSKRKKLLDAHSYRKFLNQFRHKGSVTNTSKKDQASVSHEVKLIERNHMGYHKNPSTEDAKDAVEGSSFGSTSNCGNENINVASHDEKCEVNAFVSPNVMPISQGPDGSIQSSPAEKDFRNNCSESKSEGNEGFRIKESMLTIYNVENMRCGSDTQTQKFDSCTANNNLTVSVEIAEGDVDCTGEKQFLTVPMHSCSNACVVCKQPGRLLCCEGKGCERSFHLGCLNPSLKDVPPGVWLCPLCTRKKLELGVYAVSSGIECVCDVKDELQNCKDYLVKYKGLAHVHNQWIQESVMLVEAPSLLSKFEKKFQKDKVVNWRKEWTEPQRMLLKRIVPLPEVSDENYLGHRNSSTICRYEWLVMWKGLGYEHATWEFENSPILSTPDAKMLVEDYGRRHEEPKKLTDPSFADEARKAPFEKLLRLPDGVPLSLGHVHLNSVNRLCEFWHKSQYAILIDDQERITKLILFLLSIRPRIYQPFLIVTSLTSLLLWDDAFLRIAPSMNVVVYKGSQDVRKMIRTLEFFAEDGSVMFEVLLSHSDAVFEDFEALNCISWEAVVYDDYTNLKLSKHLEGMRSFTCRFRLVLLNSPLKDNIVEYHNLFSLLDSGGEEDCVGNLKLYSGDTAGKLAIIKERFARHLADERKSESSRFIEYWVPVPLSDVQLEEYCAALVSNSTVLCSCLKVDHVGALCDILMSTRKCCSHPYLVDSELQSSLTKDLALSEYLSVGVKASGKLQLLDRVLHEMQSLDLKVLILFQSVAGGTSIADILDDFLRQRFGIDSYERIDKGLMMSKKLAALKKFNNKENGRFVFLIENRACLPSIKLTSLDCVIIYDSDWNPLNDLKSLQKIGLDSKCEPVKVFRLYSPYTVEERALAYAKQDIFLESNAQNINASFSHALLSWGAPYLFGKLDNLHKLDNQNNQSDLEKYNSLLKDVEAELLALLSKKDEDADFFQCSILIKALQSGNSYSRNIMLSRKEEGLSTLDIDPPSFWSNLLAERWHKWKYISGNFQRSRRKAQIFDELGKEENEEARKKRRKVNSSSVDAIPASYWHPDRRMGDDSNKDNALLPHTLSSCGLHQATTSPKDSLHVQSSIFKTHEVPISQGELDDCHPSEVKSDSAEEIHNAQRNLHLLLKPDLSKLCEILSFPEEVKLLAEKFLAHIMNNLKVIQESETILQAFKISLCWRAASFLKQNVDFKESLALAKKILNFECNEQQVEIVYKKLRMLKKVFPRNRDMLISGSDPNTLVDQPSTPQKEKLATVTPDYQDDIGHFRKFLEHPDLERHATLSKEVVGFPDNVAIRDLHADSAARNSEMEILNEELNIMSKDAKDGEQAERCESGFRIEEFNAGGQSRDPESLDDTGMEFGNSLRRMDMVRTTESTTEFAVSNEAPSEMPTSICCSSVERALIVPGNVSSEVWSEIIHSTNILPGGECEVITGKETSASQTCTMPEILPFTSQNAVECVPLENQVLQTNQITTVETVVISGISNVVTKAISPREFGMDSEKQLPVSQTNVSASPAEKHDTMLLNSTAASVEASQHDIVSNSDRCSAITERSSLAEFAVPNESLSEMPASISCSSAERILIEPRIVASEACSEITSSTNILPGGECEAITKKDTSVSHSCTIPEIPSVTSSDAMECVPLENQVLQTNQTTTVKAVVISGISNVASTAMSPREFDMDPEKQIPVSQSNVLASSAEMHDAMVTNSAEASVEASQHAHVSNSDRRSLITVTEHSSLATAPGNATCQSSLENQILSFGGNRSAVCGAENFTCSSLPQQTDGLSQLPDIVGLPQIQQQLQHDPIRTDDDHRPEALPVGMSEPSEIPMIQTIANNLELNLEPCLQASETSLPDLSHSNLLQQPIHLDATRVGMQQEPGCNFMQLLPMPSLQILYAQDPLQYELVRLRLQQESLTKRQEDKIFQLKLECDQEVEKVRRKYAALTDDVNQEFLQSKMILRTIHDKVRLNHELAEQFKTSFIECKPKAPAISPGQAAGNAQASLQGQHPQLSQRLPSTIQLTPSFTNPQLSQRPPEAIPHMPPPHATGSTPAPFPSGQIIGLQQRTLAHNLQNQASVLPPHPHAQSSSVAITPPQVPSSLPSPRFMLPSPGLAGSVTPSQTPWPHFAYGQSGPRRPSFVSGHLPSTGVHLGGEPRAPAPHLQRFRSPAASMPPPSAMVPPLHGLPPIQKPPLADTHSRFYAPPVFSPSAQNLHFPMASAGGASQVTAISPHGSQLPDPRFEPTQLEGSGSNPPGGLEDATVLAAAPELGVVCLSDDE